jgi:hypothetical protein
MEITNSRSIRTLIDICTISCLSISTEANVTNTFDARISWGTSSLRITSSRRWCWSRTIISKRAGHTIANPTEIASAREGPWRVGTLSIAITVVCMLCALVNICASSSISSPPSVALTANTRERGGTTRVWITRSKHRGQRILTIVLSGTHYLTISCPSICCVAVTIVTSLCVLANRMCHASVRTIRALVNICANQSGVRLTIAGKAGITGTRYSRVHRSAS